MNVIARSYPSRALATALLAILCIAALPARSRAQAQRNDKPAAIVWINSYYGPNNSGIGLAARYSALGIGATVFGFAADSAQDLPVRPGGVGISIDAYLAIDCTNWLALYGNVGIVGRLSTYKGQEELVKKYTKRTVFSLGGGAQISVVSHLMFGAGFNVLIDTPDHEGGPTYRPIQSIVAQLGYRL